MLDIQKIVINTVNEMQSEGKLEELVKEKIQGAMKSAIDGCFDYDFRKNLTNKVKELLAIDLDKISLPEYNTLLCNEIEAIAKANVIEAGIAKAKANLQEVMNRKAPEVLKLSEIVEAVKCDAKYDHEKYDRVTLEIDRSYSTAWVVISLVPVKSLAINKQAVRFAVREDMTVSGVYVKGFQNDLTKSIFAGSVYGAEAQLFAAYAHGTKIELDEDACNLYFNENELEDY